MSGETSLVATPADGDGGMWSGFDSAGSSLSGVPTIGPAVLSAEAFNRGDWIEGSVQYMSGGLDTLGLVLNPIAGVCSAAASWLIQHCGYAQQLLDELVGDPAEISAASATWQNIATRLDTVGSGLTDAVTTDLADFDGLTADAYRGYASVESATIQGLAQVANGVSGGLLVAGGLLAGIRDFITVLLSEIVGEAVQALAVSVATFGVAAPGVLAKLVGKAMHLVQRCRQFAMDLARSLARMATLVDDVSEVSITAMRAVETSVRTTRRYVNELDLAMSMMRGMSRANDLPEPQPA